MHKSGRDARSKHGGLPRRCPAPTPISCSATRTNVKIVAVAYPVHAGNGAAVSVHWSMERAVRVHEIPSVTTSYSCKILDADDHMIATKLFQAANDRVAINRARRIFSQEHGDGYEAWAGERLIYRELFRPS